MSTISVNLRSKGLSDTNWEKTQGKQVWLSLPDTSSVMSLLKADPFAKEMLDQRLANSTAPNGSKPGFKVFVSRDPILLETTGRILYHDKSASDHEEPGTQEYGNDTSLNIQVTCRVDLNWSSGHPDMK